MTIDKTIKSALAITITSITLLSLVSYSANAATGISSSINNAVNNSSRPAEDLTLDANRKPAQVLNFFQVTPNTQVLEVFAGGGYYTELLNDIVGKDGHVTVYEDSMWYDYSKTDSDKRHRGKRLKNTNTVISDMNTLRLPKEKYDTTVIVLGLHDIYLKSEKSLSGDKRNINHFLNALYHSLKPGGVMGVVEHEATIGEQASTSAELHRLNSALIKKVMLDAGFTFEASSALLANPNDDHTKVVWAKGLRRKTDRSVLKFRKPQ
jgi:predicted methyltransferase